MKPEITINDSCSVEAMECMRQHSDPKELDRADCIMDDTFVFYNNIAKVSGNCSCDFKICHATKRLYDPPVTTTLKPIPVKDQKEIAKLPKDLGKYNRDHTQEDEDKKTKFVDGKEAPHV